MAKKQRRNALDKKIQTETTTLTVANTLPIDQIRMDGGTQMRALINETTVEEYAESMDAGDHFPPVVVFYDGTDYWLGDGFHRLRAAARLDRTEIAVDMRSGTRREAVLYASGANKAHGLRRTNEDKRLSVTTLLRDDEWSQWSDREIGRQCGVDHKTVGNLRKELKNLSGEIPQIESPRKVRRGDQEYTQKAAPKREYVTIPQLEQGIRLWVDELHPDNLPEQIAMLVTLQEWGTQFEALLKTDHLSGPRRKRDVKQAVNNVLSQLSQRLAEVEKSAPSGEIPQIDESTQQAQTKQQAPQQGWSLFTRADGQCYATNEQIQEATALYDSPEARQVAIAAQQHNPEWYQIHDDIATLCSRPASGSHFKETLAQVSMARVSEALRLVKLEDGAKTRVQALERRLRQLEKEQGSLEAISAELRQVIGGILESLDSQPEVGGSYVENYRLLFEDDDWVAFQNITQSLSEKLKKKF